MVLRLVLGILAVVLLPLGLVFVVIGLTADEIRKGEPETFVYVGAPLALVGIAFAIAFELLRRREAERRSRRRAGTRTTAEIVRAQWKPGIRIGSAVAVDLTVRFAAAGLTGQTVTRLVLLPPGSNLVEGQSIEIVYDPTDPSNFEPVGQLTAT